MEAKRSLAEQVQNVYNKQIPPLPRKPPLVFTGTPAKFSQLRKILKAHKPVEKHYKQSTRFMITTPPAVQRALREIAADEQRTIVAVTNVILGLGLRAYAKLAQGITPEQAVDALTEEIRT